MIAVVSLPISDISKKGIETKTDDEANTEDKDTYLLIFKTIKNTTNAKIAPIGFTAKK